MSPALIHRNFFMQDSPSVRLRFSILMVFSSSRGQWPTHESTANEATHELGGYRD